MPVDLPRIFTYALEFSESIKYALLFLGVIIEGPILMVVCGFFLRFGQLDIIPLFTVLFAGDLLADAIWYVAGARFGEKVLARHGKLFGMTLERFVKVKELFHRYHERILLISKVTVGFGMAIVVLVAAGVSRVSFRRFMGLNALGELILVSALLAVGFAFGELYDKIAAGFRDVFIVGAVIMAGILIYGFSHYMKGRITGSTNI